jgi:hypothetical protein
MTKVKARYGYEFQMMFMQIMLEKMKEMDMTKRELTKRIGWTMKKYNEVLEMKNKDSLTIHDCGLILKALDVSMLTFGLLLQGYGVRIQQNEDKHKEEPNGVCPVCEHQKNLPDSECVQHIHYK